MLFLWKSLFFYIFLYKVYFIINEVNWWIVVKYLINEQNPWEKKERKKGYQKILQNPYFISTLKETT